MLHVRGDAFAAALLFACAVVMKPFLAPGFALLALISINGVLLAWTVAAGITLGFIYWCFEGLTFALGETGLLPPLIAVWAPLVAFMALVGTIGFHQEFRRTPRRE